MAYILLAEKLVSDEDLRLFSLKVEGEQEQVCAEIAQQERKQKWGEVPYYFQQAALLRTNRGKMHLLPWGWHQAIPEGSGPMTQTLGPVCNIGDQVSMWGLEGKMSKL